MTLRELLNEYQRKYSFYVSYTEEIVFFGRFDSSVELNIRCYKSLLDNDIATLQNVKSINVGEKGGKKLVCVVFEDGSHIIKKCHKEDDFDINVGVALCLVEKYFGSKNKFHKFIKSRLTEKSKLKLEEWKEDDKTGENSSRSIG